MQKQSSVLILSNKGKQKHSSPEQKTFHRLQKKVEGLQRLESELAQELDTALKLYQEHIHPIRKRISDLIAERVRVSYRLYRESTKLSAADREHLKELISDDVGDVLSQYLTSESPEDLRQIFKELNGFEYHEGAEEAFEVMKDELTNLFREEMGVDVDFSSIDLDDRPDEMIQKMFASAASSYDQMPKDHLRKKGKKQLAKEKLKAQMEEAQKKTLNTIYRQLAKALHPDLETDVLKKDEKLQLMKRLTAAYEAGDLPTLLALEQQWLAGLENTSFRTQEQLKIYNEILKDQVRDLELRVGMLWHQPEYFPLHDFSDSPHDCMVLLRRAHFEIHSEEQELRNLVEQLKSPRSDSLMRQMIREHKRAEKRGEREDVVRF